MALTSRTLHNYRLKAELNINADSMRLNQNIRIVSSLTRKNVKITFRKKTNRVLIVFSSFLLFGILLFCSLHSQKLNFFSSVGYAKLAFDMICAPYKFSAPTLSECKPYQNPTKFQAEDEGVSPTKALLTFLQTKNIASNSDSNGNGQRDSYDVATLLGSLIMNGLPLLGLLDFIKMSDYINENMGENTRTEILASSVFQERFGNFLLVRDRELRITPDNCWSRNFVEHLKRAEITKNMKVVVYPSMKSAMRDCCDNFWAVLELATTGTSTLSEPDTESDASCHHHLSSEEEVYLKQGSNEGIKRIGVKEGVMPEVTIRMHPSAIPDTRNFKWSPMKNGMPKQESGQLLYFLSGFLSLQLEIQNYLSQRGFGGPIISTQVFRDSSAFPRLSEISVELASKIMTATSSDDIFSIFTNATSNDHPKSHRLAVPLYHRAFPTHPYAQNQFWHSFGSMATIGLIIFFSLPAAVIAGAFRREVSGGQLDVLSSIPGVLVEHSAAAWCFCGATWLVISFLTCLLYFLIVLLHSDALVPSLGLALCGFALAPMSLILGCIVRRADTLIVAVPTFVFVTMLPGLLYFDLAFDLQRNIFVEVIICLLPPSAAALMLRLVCALEALGVAATWTSRAAISGTPIYVYVIMLLFDIVVYGMLSTLLLRIIHSNRISLDRTSTSPSLHNEYQDTRDSPQNNTIKKGQYSAMKVMNVSKEYFSAEGIVEVLSNINAELLSGCVTCLLGSNGAGKTTLMRIICGLDSSHTGVISVCNEGKHGKEFGGSNGSGSSNYWQKKRHGKRRREIGWCPQNDAVFDYLTIEEHLSLFGNLLGYDDDTTTSEEEIILDTISIDTVSEINTLHTRRKNTSKINGSKYSKLLISLGIEEHRHKYAKMLSGGMKRRLALTLALIGDPFILLLDEPTNACDSYTREIVRKVILARRKRSAILISTHHVDDVEVVSDRVWFLNDRYLAFDGPVAALSGSDSKDTTNIKVAVAHSVTPTIIVANDKKDLNYQEDNDKYFVSKNNSNDDKTSLSPLEAVTSCLEFSTWNEQIKALFRHEFPKAICCFVERSYGVNSRLFNLSPTIPVREPLAGNNGGNVVVINSKNESKITSDIQQSNTTTTAVKESSLTVWDVTGEYFDQLQKFLLFLDDKSLRDWSVCSPSIYHVLGKMYSSKDQETDDELSRKILVPPVSVTTNISPEITIARNKRSRSRSRTTSNALEWGMDDDHANLVRSDHKSNWFYSTLESISSRTGCWSCQWLSWLHCQYHQFRIVVFTRMKELKSHLPQFLLTQFLIPFLVVLAVVYSCRDVDYPKVELTSKTVGGVGEVLVGLGNEVFSTIPISINNRKFSYSGDPVTQSSSESQKISMNEDNNEYDEQTDKNSLPGFYNLQSILGHNIKWAGRHYSDDMWANLYDTYYQHKDSRWASFVVEDTIPKWIESSVYILETSLQIPLDSAFQAIIDAQNTICNTTVKNVTAAVEEVHARICGNIPYIQSNIEFINTTTTTTVNGTTTTTTEIIRSLVVSVFETLLSNVTMLSNVTTDHAAPVFLKEITPAIYSSIYDNGNDTNQYLIRYQLFSHPLPEINLANPVYLERGYVGSIMLVFYMLIMSVASVRFVTMTRASGLKLQLHMAGISATVYWIANYLCDVLFTMLPLFATYVAILIGGEPIRSFFFFTFPTYPGLLFLLCLIGFSFGIVASNFAFSAVSYDTLTSQLSTLISTVVLGLFMKLYLSLRNHDIYYLRLSKFLLWISPCYAFSSCMFDIFAYYASQLGKTVGILKPAGIHEVYTALLALTVQSIVYLFLTILIDISFSRIRYFYSRFKYQFLEKLKKYYTQSALPVQTQGINDDKLKAMLIKQSFMSSTHTTKGRNTTNTFSISEVAYQPIDDDITSSTMRQDQDQNRKQHNNNMLTIKFKKENNNCIQQYALVGSRKQQPAAVEQNKILSTYTQTTINENNTELPSIHTTTTPLAITASQMKKYGAIEILHRKSQLVNHHTNNNKTVEEKVMLQKANIDTNNHNNNINISTSSKNSYYKLEVKEEDETRRIITEETFSRRYESLNFTKNTNNRIVVMTSNDLCVRYPKRNILALKDIKVDIQQGEKVALIGINGGGKSTFFKSLALNENVPVSGSLRMNGRDSIHGQWMFGQEGVLGYVPQEGGLPEFLTVREALYLFHSLKKNSSTRSNSASNNDNEHNRDSYSDIPYILSIFPKKYLSYPIQALSGGNKRKLAVVLANIHSPSMLLLDEPTSGVDPVAAERIVRYLRQLNPSQCMLFSSHRIDECVRVCSRVLMLYKGKIEFDGPMHSFDQLASRYYQVDIILVINNLDDEILIRKDNTDKIAEFKNDIDYSTNITNSSPSTVYNKSQEFKNYHHTIHNIKNVIKSIESINKNNMKLTRIVEYSPTYLRITCEKMAYPLSSLWIKLVKLQNDKRIDKFSFRSMDMEEVLSIIIEDETFDSEESKKYVGK